MLVASDAGHGLARVQVGAGPGRKGTIRTEPTLLFLLAGSTKGHLGRCVANSQFVLAVRYVVAILWRRQQISRA